LSALVAAEWRISPYDFIRVKFDNDETICQYEIVAAMFLE
jgi:hypothetical protein